MADTDPRRARAAEYRLAAAERIRDLEQRYGGEEGSGAKPKRARRAAAKTKVVAGYWLKRGLDAARQAIDRATTKRPKADPALVGKPFLVIGHRGSAANVVENTIESCEYAIGVEGANAVEIDLSYTKDDEVVLWHDWDPNDAIALARQVGFEPNVKFLPYAPNLFSRHRRDAHELTVDELREHYGYKKRFLFFFSKKIEARIPTFGDFLAWAKKHPRLKVILLDMKIPADKVEYVPKMVGKMLRQIEASGVRADFVFLSPHPTIFDEMKKFAPSQDYSFDVEVPPGIVFDAGKCSATRTAIKMGNSYASVGRPALTLGAWKIYQEIITHDVKIMAEHNAQLGDDEQVELFSWTINKRPEAKRLINLGVDGILTDKPATLKRIAEKLGRRVE